MQPTISIPQNWKYPRFTVGQRTEQGIIIGIKVRVVGDTKKEISEVLLTE
ncbi:hypothetical protein IQ243_24650 [Nostocales cyanobacterium LEGE 11386]|nr:hypothetical protein [Nostocales cyanobacterium LEGE 11386]